VLLAGTAAVSQHTSKVVCMQCIPLCGCCIASAVGLPLTDVLPLLLPLLLLLLLIWAHRHLQVLVSM
jgi:hypothetical protein